jgi:hypothetical protein
MMLDQFVWVFTAGRASRLSAQFIQKQQRLSLENCGRDNKSWFFEQEFTLRMLTCWEKVVFVAGMEFLKDRGGVGEFGWEY